MIAKLHRNSSGNVIVEMVFALPMLFVLIVGIVEVGQAIHRHQTITDGTRAAVRYLTRVPDPCLALEQQRAFGLLVTRSTDWSKTPLFPDWPATYAAFTSDTKFTTTLTGCTEGALLGDVLTLRTRYRIADSSGVLDIIGHKDGFFIETLHQERHIGL
jgi:hypothetical protein